MKLTEIYEGSTYTVEFASSRPQRSTYKGKYYPITTQCVIKCNELVIGVGEVVKHEKDNNNPLYAKSYAAKKAFKNTGYKTWRELRERFWKQIITK